MRFLIDRCAGRRLAYWLRSQEHDVSEVADLPRDPGDRALLALAHEENRILVTLDSDFGNLIFVESEPHAGLIRLPDVPAARRIELVAYLLRYHAEELGAGAILTIRGDRIRISRL